MKNPAQLTQKEAILNFLKQGCSITQLDALHLFGCMRLAPRIIEIKRMGYDVISENYKTPSGKTVSQYFLAEFKKQIEENRDNALFSQLKTVMDSK